MNPHISIHAENIFQIGGFHVTNALLLSVLVFAVFAVFAIILRRKLSLIPNTLQNVAEIILEGALGIMDSVLLDRRKSEKYLPLVLTIFLFVLFSNWFGLLPGVGSIVVSHTGGESVPLFRSPASDLNFTLALALISVTLINVFAAAALGARLRFKVFFNFESPIKFFVGLLELISEFARIISFSFRLFGNVFAGEVLLTIIAFLLPYAGPLPFVFLEVFVGFIQAFIFGMLTLIFTAIATTDEHGESSPAENISLQP